MGFFSFPCQRCGRSILSEYSADHAWLTHATIRTKQGKIIDGKYDGYGNLDTEFGTFDIAPTFTEEDNTWRIWHSECYALDDNRMNESAVTKHAPDQGFFIEKSFYQCTSAKDINDFIIPPGPLTG